MTGDGTSASAVAMPPRAAGPFRVSAVALGCMNLSHAYGVPPDRETGVRLLNEALDMGYTMLDTAALYGFGANETLLGEAVGHRRDDYVLASKCVLRGDDAGKRVLDGRPEVLKATCEGALKRLKTDVIDLYYLHRYDKSVPLEDSVGALVDLKQEGKIRAIGLSEVSADTLRCAHQIHPIAAVQNEYSLWSRNVEIAVLEACRDLDVALVAFSPLARGFLGGLLRDVGTLAEKDIRRGMPRFAPETYGANLALLDKAAPLAEEAGCSLAQLAMAWVLSRGPHVIALPGTTKAAHMRENAEAALLSPDPALLERLGEIINQNTVVGPRYPASTQAEIDTEDFA